MIDYDKLKDYIEILIVERERINGTSHSYAIRFKNCDPNDFLILEEEKIIKGFTHRLCPDFDQFKDLIKVKGSYSNNIERYSFSIEIHHCNLAHNPNCKPDEEIEMLMNSIFFTLYTVQAKVQFVNEYNPGASPIIVRDDFHS